MGLWELQDGKEQLGPLEEDHVVRMIAAGLPATTRVRPAGKETWKMIGAHEPFAVALAGVVVRPAPAAIPAALAMPETPPWTNAAPQNTRHATVVRAPTAVAGKGCLIQGLGLLVAPPVTILAMMVMGIAGIVVGLLVLLLFVAIGRSASASWNCGACGNAVNSQAVRMCSTCKATLSA